MVKKASKWGIEWGVGAMRGGLELQRRRQFSKRCVVVIQNTQPPFPYFLNSLVGLIDSWKLPPVTDSKRVPWLPFSVVYHFPKHRSHKTFPFFFRLRIYFIFHFFLQIHHFLPFLSNFFLLFFTRLHSPTSPLRPTKKPPPAATAEKSIQGWRRIYSYSKNFCDRGSWKLCIKNDLNSKSIWPPAAANKMNF